MLLSFYIFCLPSDITGFIILGIEKLKKKHNYLLSWHLRPVSPPEIWNDLALFVLELNMLPEAWWGTSKCNFLIWGLGVWRLHAGKQEYAVFRTKCGKL